MQVYEAKGGGYENQEGSKNEAKKGAPEPKDKAKKAASKKTGQVPAFILLVVLLPACNAQICHKDMQTNASRCLF